MLSAVPFPSPVLARLPTMIGLPPEDASGQFYVCALFVLNHYFGMKWTERWIMSRRGEKGGFLRNGWATRDHVEAHKLRVLILAELLVNLQDAPGFLSVLEPMVHKGVEVGIAELEAGAFLKKRGIKFNFNVPSGVRGRDYDLNIDLNGLYVCGETKCKVEATAPTVKSFLNSVEDARHKNLHANQPGAVFIKIPQIWYENVDFKAQLQAELPRYLQTAGRLATVIISVSPEIQDKKYAASLSLFKAVTNNQSRFYDPRIEILNDAMVVPNYWTSLVQLWGSLIPSYNHASHMMVNDGIQKLTDF